jgi:hypothetical protein
MAQLGSALVWGTRGRQFESAYPDVTSCSAAWLARLLWEQEAASSNLASSTCHTVTQPGNVFKQVSHRRQWLGYLGLTPGMYGIWCIAGAGNMNKARACTPTGERLASRVSVWGFNSPLAHHGHVAQSV